MPTGIHFAALLLLPPPLICLIKQDISTKHPKSVPDVRLSSSFLRAWPPCDASGHDSSESLRAPTSAVTTALDAEGSGQGQSLPAPEDVKEQAQLARAVQEDVAKAKDSLREGQAAMVGACHLCN